jgi:hypothetical protein
MLGRGSLISSLVGEIQFLFSIYLLICVYLALRLISRAQALVAGGILFPGVRISENSH